MTDSVSTQPSWQSQDDVLRLLWLESKTPPEIADKLGRSVAAVMTRAARLGLPRRFSPGRKPGQANNALRQKSPPLVSRTAASRDQTETTQRICLMCLKVFASAGRHNRICLSCKGSSEYASASSLPDIQLTTV